MARTGPRKLSPHWFDYLTLSPESNNFYATNNRFIANYFAGSSGIRFYD
jgi:hypothetical protein